MCYLSSRTSRLHRGGPALGRLRCAQAHPAHPSCQGSASESPCKLSWGLRASPMESSPGPPRPDTPKCCRAPPPAAVSPALTLSSLFSMLLTLFPLGQESFDVPLRHPPTSQPHTSDKPPVGEPGTFLITGSPCRTGQGTSDMSVPTSDTEQPVPRREKAARQAAEALVGTGCCREPPPPARDRSPLSGTAGCTFESHGHEAHSSLVRDILHAHSHTRTDTPETVSHPDIRIKAPGNCENRDRDVPAQTPL